jgi:hypothetical protein
MVTFKTFLNENPSRYSIRNVFFVVNGYERSSLEISTENGVKNPSEVKLGDNIRIGWTGPRNNSEGRVVPTEVNVWAVPVSSANELPELVSNKYLVAVKVKQNSYWKVGTWNSLYAPPIIPGRGAGSYLSALPEGRYVLYYTPVDLEGETWRVKSGLSTGSLLGFAATRPVFAGYDYTEFYGMSQPFEIKGGSLPGWDQPTDLYVDAFTGKAFLMRAKTSSGAINQRENGLGFSSSFRRDLLLDASSNYLSVGQALAEKNWLGGTIRAKAGDTLTIDWMEIYYNPPVGNDPTVSYGNLQTAYFTKMAQDIRAENYTPYIAPTAASSVLELRPKLNAYGVEERPVDFYSPTTGALNVTGSSRPRCSTGFNLGDADWTGDATTYTVRKPWVATNSRGSTTITIPECENGREYRIFYNGDGLGLFNVPTSPQGYSPNNYLANGHGMDLRIVIEGTPPTPNTTVTTTPVTQTPTLPPSSCTQRTFRTNTSGYYSALAGGSKLSSVAPGSTFYTRCDFGVVSGFVTLSGNAASY